MLNVQRLDLFFQLVLVLLEVPLDSFLSVEDASVRLAQVIVVGAVDELFGSFRVVTGRNIVKSSAMSVDGNLVDRAMVLLIGMVVDLLEPPTDVHNVIVVSSVHHKEVLLECQLIVEEALAAFDDLLLGLLLGEEFLFLLLVEIRVRLLHAGLGFGVAVVLRIRLTNLVNTYFDELFS